ncbi:Protein of unknown function, partial [Cotesia congregata]
MQWNTRIYKQRRIKCSILSFYPQFRFFTFLYIYTNFFLLLFYLVCSTTSFDRVHFYLVVFFSISFPSQISRLHCTGNWEIKVNQQENIIPHKGTKLPKKNTVHGKKYPGK